MAYPLLCSGGYPVPEFDGVREIAGINFTPTVVGSPMEVVLRDANNAEYNNDPDHNKHEVVKVLADGNQSYFQMFTSPIKTRRGIRATTLINATRVILYVR